MVNNKDARRFTGIFGVHLAMQTKAVITVKFCCNRFVRSVCGMGYNFPMLCMPYVQDLMKMSFKVAIFIF